MGRSVRGLTIIRNDTAQPGRGIARLVQSGCVAKAIVSHLGANPVTQQKIILAIARTLSSAGSENSFRLTFER
jgi:acyl CoA:acetate/3-ketoacid CoA transferase alpha subunit